MTKIVLIACIALALYLLHRLCLWLESNGWIYYINKKAESGALSSSLQELNAFLNPSVRHTIEMKQNQVVVYRRGKADAASDSNNNTDHPLNSEDTMKQTDYMNSDDYKKGLETFASKYEPQRKVVIDKLNDFSPELADVVIAHGLGDIWVNKTSSLSVREKEIAVLASLITSCTVHSEIKAHAQCLLNVGVTKEEIKELLVLMTLYIGVPKVIVAMQLIDEAFTEYDKAHNSPANIT